MILSLILACTPQTDAEAYLAAAADPTDPAPCSQIRDPGLAGECRAMAATALAGEGDVDAGLLVCETLAETDPWRGECFFLISDRIPASGQQAIDICARSGQFADRCLGHALGREGRTLLEQVTPGEELAAYRAIRERSALYFPDPRDAGRKLWHLMVEFVASRDHDQPFSAATCGTLPENICQTGFLTRLRFAVRDSQGSEHTLHELCRSRPVSVEAAVAAGLPAWREDADSIAQGAWGKLCGGR